MFRTLSSTNNYYCSYNYIGANDYYISTYYNNWRDNHNLKESVSNKAFTMKMKTLGDTYGISHRVKMDHSVFVVDPDVLRPTIAKDFNIQV
jgi:hypothetical protein